MAFYINPPKGSIALQTLTEFANIRLQFLIKILDTDGDRIKLQDIVMNQQTVLGSECLIEGSAKDRISHFILRLACCMDPEMALFFIKAETLLFDWRFSCMTEDELCRLFKSVDPYLTFHSHRNLKKMDENESNSCNKETEEIANILQTFNKIKTPCGRWRKVVKKYLNGESTECFYVPFQSVLNLVCGRKVRLKKGIAAVPYCYLQTVTVQLFKHLLTCGMHKMKAKPHYEDERISKLTNNLVTRFKRWHYRRVSSPYREYVSHRDIDSLALYFPPCMSHALRLLRTRHRLGHHTRVTLFLKEVGLPIHEALMFWREEYSQTPQGEGHKCGHDWVHNERRYTYNIRHLYGLEGSRTNYRGHSCQYLQEEFQGHREEGGCPFSQFDIENIGELIKLSGYKGDTRNIVGLAANGEPSAACTALLYENLKVYRAAIPKCESEDQNLVMSTSKIQLDQHIPHNVQHLNNHQNSAYRECRNLDNCSKSDLDDCPKSDLDISPKLNLDKCLKSNRDNCTKSVTKVETREQSEDLVAMPHVEGVHAEERKIAKPIDFFVSYRNFVEKLQNLK